MMIPGDMWGMFSSTGNIEYYLLYRALIDGQKLDEERERRPERKRFSDAPGKKWGKPGGDRPSRMRYRDDDDHRRDFGDRRRDGGRPFKKSNKRGGRDAYED